VGDQLADVIVVGGGPAGAATALSLASLGRSVVVIDATSDRECRPGEILPPAARAALTTLGVWQRFIDDRHASSPGILSAWGQHDLFETNFIFNAHGSGWHLDRARFDAMLACEAESAGAVFVRNARPGTPARNTTGWQIPSRRGRGSPLLSARFLVDATGRAASIARSQGSKRVGYDRLIGCVAMMAPVSCSSSTHDCLLVEAVRSGWWYSAVLPDEQLVVAYMTDADLCAQGRSQLLPFWSGRLDETFHTRARTQGYRLRSIRIRAANSFRTETVVGRGWLAVGDAAAAFDPLSSQGICRALRWGVRAAVTVDSCLRGSRTALEDYAAAVLHEAGVYLTKRFSYYGSERRWRDNPFWNRRQRDPKMLGVEALSS
jgi:flavin-dependent dehydrogenase